METAAKAASFSNDAPPGIIAVDSEQFTPKRGINKARGGEKPKRVPMEAKDHTATRSLQEQMPFSGRPMFDMSCTIQSEDARRFLILCATSGSKTCFKRGTASEAKICYY